MIQDIGDKVFDNAFRLMEPEGEDIFISVEGASVLTVERDGALCFPQARCIKDEKTACAELHYGFSIDDRHVFLAGGRIGGDDMKDGGEGYSFRAVRRLRRAGAPWMTLAAFTGMHLIDWHRKSRYCGRCGAATRMSGTERARICPECGNRIYPRINPVIMAAVTDGSRILVTRYAGRAYKGMALVAGFVETGETLEQALRREVMEETGIEVGSLRYFGSQPWGLSGSVISGYFADLRGSSEVTVDRTELAEAVWVDRDDLPEQNTDISITSAMIEAFRRGDAV